MPVINKSQKTDIKNHFSDKWFFYIFYPIISILVIHIGNDNTFSELIKISSYYSDIAISLTITYLIGIYLHFYHKKWAFQEKLINKRKILNILFWGVLLPLILGIGTEILYLVIILDIPLPQSSVFYLELPLAFMFLVVINLTYLLLNQGNGKNIPQIPTSANPKSKSHFLVFSGSKALHIPSVNVAYFIILEKSTFLVTLESEKYIYDKSIEEIFNEVDKTDFYQINRQVIAQRCGIDGFSNTMTRRLKVTLNPSTDFEIFVSKTKAKEFMNWLQSIPKTPLSN